MHWVWATDAHTRNRIPVNLAAIPTMARAKRPDGVSVTILFIGGIAVRGDQDVYAQTHVLETPEELLAAPAVLPPSVPQPKSKAKGRSE